MLRLNKLDHFSVKSKQKYKAWLEVLARKNATAYFRKMKLKSRRVFVAKPFLRD
jgi:hypothetical protein